jgi:catechol-2,3-dioxygenase
MTASRKTDVPKIFRITLEVSSIDEAAGFYAKLLGTKASDTRGRDTTSTAEA